MTIVGEEKSGNVPLLSRRRRSTDNITNASPDLATANISVVIVTTGCRVYDPNRETWDPNGCTVCNYNAMVYTLFIYFLTSFIVYGNNAVIKFSFFFYFGIFGQVMDIILVGLHVFIQDHGEYIQYTSIIGKYIAYLYEP